MTNKKEQFARLVITKNQLDFNTKIGQYLDIQFLVNILIRNQYYIKRKKEFADLMESSLNIKDLFYVNIAGKEYGKFINRKYGYDKRGYDFHKCSGDLFTSCWTTDVKENILWWDRGINRFKVCIKSTINNFLASFLDKNMHIVCGEIDYRTISPDQDHRERLFIKTSEFAAEKEMRFYFIPKKTKATYSLNNKHENKGVNLSIDPGVMIDEIILSPYLDSSLAHHICEMIKNFCGIKVKQSRLRLKK